MTASQPGRKRLVFKHWVLLFVNNGKISPTIHGIWSFVPDEQGRAKRTI